MNNLVLSNSNNAIVHNITTVAKHSYTPLNTFLWTKARLVWVHFMESHRWVTASDQIAIIVHHELMWKLLNVGDIDI